MKKLISLECPHCGYQWTVKYWAWIFQAPMHWFKFRDWRDYRYTKCPSCKKKGWIRHS